MDPLANLDDVRYFENLIVTGKLRRVKLQTRVHTHSDKFLASESIS